MGGLSRKRTIKRIVKVRKQKSVRHINKNRFENDYVRKIWDQNKSIK